MRRFVLLTLLSICVCVLRAQEEVLEDIYNYPDSTAETIYQYAKSHDIEDIDGKMVTLWQPYVLYGASCGDKYLGVIPITLFVFAQDFVLKNGDMFSQGKIMLYVPIGQGVYELTEQKIDAIKAKLKVNSFVVNASRNDYAWKKDRFKISAREEWILGKRNIYITFHCVSYPQKYKIDFLK